MTPFNLVVSGSTVYWSDNGGNAIRRVSINGGTITTLSDQAGAPAGLATDGLNVYWAAQSGFVMKVPVNGGPTTILATTGNAFFIAVDATTVYWTVAAFGFPGRVDKVAK